MVAVVLLLAPSSSVDSQAAPIVRGTGNGALIGNDLTDVGDNGAEGSYVDGAAIPPAVLSGFDGRFFASSEAGFGGGEFAYNVFDNLTGGSNNKWCCQGVSQTIDGAGQFVGADFSQTIATGAARITLNRFTLTSSNDSPNRDPDYWFIQGSNDGTTWTNIFSYTANNGGDNATGVPGLWGTARNQVLEFSVANGDFTTPVGYQQFRLFVDSTGTSNVFALGELELFGYQYWDIDGANAGAGGTHPDGTWSNAAANWSYSDAGSYATSNWISGGDAVFSAGTDATGSPTITISGGVNAHNIIVEQGTPTITASTLTLSGLNPTITVNSPALTIQSVIAGSSGLVKGGAGVLLLTNSNTYTGGTTITQGTLRTTNTNALGTGTLIMNGGTLNTSVDLANNITL
ncbi:MAG: autotransporter-associated beta strand repeat-containing protein, partial [Planctomycetales bacterium]|nr:autotransporter-associated beta strand repeat-containing protein [Planctomycetales bacterium]